MSAVLAMGAIHGGLSGDVLNYVGASLLHKLVYFGSEVVAAERALRFHLEPLRAALFVKVVLLVAPEHDQKVARHEAHQTDGAVGHVGVFLGVSLVAELGELLQVALEAELARFVSCVEQTSLNVGDLR